MKNYTERKELSMESGCFKTGIATLFIVLILTCAVFGNENADELFKQGNGLALEKNYEGAINYYDEALEIEPDNVKILLNKALALTFLGRYEKSSECFDKAIEISPDFADAWHWKGVSYVIQGQLEDGFVSIVTAFNEIDPEEENNSENLSAGGIYFEESLVFFDKAMEINPDYYQAWYWKGLALYNLGNYEEALSCYDKSLEINPDYIKAKNAREELVKLLQKSPGDF